MEWERPVEAGSVVRLHHRDPSALWISPQTFQHVLLSLSLFLALKCLPHTDAQSYEELYSVPKEKQSYLKIFSKIMRKTISCIIPTDLFLFFFSDLFLSIKVQTFSKTSHWKRGWCSYVRFSEIISHHWTRDKYRLFKKRAPGSWIHPKKADKEAE